MEFENSLYATAHSDNFLFCCTDELVKPSNGFRIEEIESS